MNLLLKVSNEVNKVELAEIIKTKIGKLEKLLPQNTKLSWNYSSGKLFHYSELRISGFKGPELRVSAKSENRFKVIDIALNKLQGRLSKRKRRNLPRYVGFMHSIENN